MPTLRRVSGHSEGGVGMDEGDYGPSEDANGRWLTSRGCVPGDELNWMRLSRVHADVAKNSKSPQA